MMITHLELSEEGNRVGTDLFLHPYLPLVTR